MLCSRFLPNGRVSSDEALERVHRLHRALFLVDLLDFAQPLLRGPNFGGLPLPEVLLLWRTLLPDDLLPSRRRLQYRKPCRLLLLRPCLLHRMAGTIVLVSYHVITISQRMMVSLFAGESMMSTSSTDHVESSLVLHTVYIEICNPIFLRHPPLNLEQFGVLNDCARPTESPPTEFTSTPNYEFDRSPNPPSRCFRQHTHHTHTIRKHFEFLLQLRRQITSLESRLLLPEC